MACQCNVGLNNTGVPGCVPIQSVTKSLILVPIKANDGSYNGVEDTDVLNEAYFTALINNADASKRWFPLPEMENIEQPKADSQFEESASGRKAFLREGVRSFAGEMWDHDSSPQLLSKLKGSRCVEFGFYSVDVDGNLMGLKVGTQLRPIPVDNASFDPKLAFTTDSTVQKIMIGFDWSRNVDEGNLWLITSVEGGVDFGSLTGLIDVTLVGTSGATTTSLVGTLSFGTFMERTKYAGADLVADWSIYNNTTLASVTIDTVVESPSGTYALAHATGITASDSYTVTVTKDGFSGSVDLVA